MGIDTREKRQNAVGVGRPWMRHKLPSTSKDEQWRIASGLGYGGNLLEEVSSSSSSSSSISTSSSSSSSILGILTFPDSKTLTKIGPTSKTITKIGPISSTVTIP